MSKQTSGKHYGCGRGGVKPPMLTVDPLFEDGFRATNPSDYYAPALLSGTARYVESGALVTVKLENHTWQARVDKNGDWSLPIPPSAITALQDVERQLIISVTNHSGKTVELTRTVEIPSMSNGTAAGIGIAPIAGDDELTGREKTHGQLISGLTEFVAEGSLVTVTLEGKSWQVPIDANGSWHLTLPPEVMKALAPGEHTLSVTAIAAYDGAFTTIDRTFTVAKGGATRCAAEITLNSITSDDVLTAIERQSGLTVSGSATNVPNGSQVWIQLGDDIYAATVKNHHWQTQIPASGLAALHDGAASIVAWVQDVNETATVVREFNVRESLTTPQITLDSPYDHFEVADPAWAMVTEVLSGTVTHVAAGTLLDIAIGELHYQACIDENGAWRLPVAPHSLLAQPVGDVPLVLSVTNGRGETAALSKTLHYNGFENSGWSQVVINPVSGDDILNAREKNTALFITGDTLNVPVGQTVEVRFPDALPDHIFFGHIDENGEWRTSLSASDLQNLPAGALRIEVTFPGDDRWSDPALSGERWVTVAPDSAAENVATLSIDSLEDYGRLTLDRLSGLTVSGRADHVADGSEVWLQAGDWVWVGAVHQGEWQVTIPADNPPDFSSGSSAIFEATVTNKANGDAAGDSVLINFDPAVPPGGHFLAIDPIWGADAITRTDDIRPYYFITGTFSGNKASHIIVTLNGIAYDAEVTDNRWMVRIPDDALRALPDGATTVTAQWNGLHDSADLTLNSHPAAPLFGATLDEVGYANVIITPESDDHGLTLSGGVLDASVAPPGTRVNIEFNGRHYQTSLGGDAENPRWHLALPATDMQALERYGNEILTVTLGEPGQQSVVVARNLELTEDGFGSAYEPQIAIDPLGDNLIEPAEAAEPMIVTGTTRYLETGHTVVLTLDDLRWEATSDSAGRWKVLIPADTLAQISDGEHQLSAVITFTDPEWGDWSIRADNPLDFQLGEGVAFASHVDLAHPEQAISLTPSEDGAPSATLASLGLSGGENAIAALLAPTEEESTAGAKALHAATEPVSLTLTAAGDTWSLAARGAEETLNYALPVPPDLNEHPLHPLV